jgi:hypothetical protein
MGNACCNSKTTLPPPDLKNKKIKRKIETYEDTSEYSAIPGGEKHVPYMREAQTGSPRGEIESFNGQNF